MSLPRVRARRAALAAMLALALSPAAGGAAAPVRFRWEPAAAPPETAVSLRIEGGLQVNEKVFVRLSGPTVQDVLLAPAELGLGNARVVVPKAPRGEYAARIVSDRNVELAAGDPLRVLAPEPPVVTRILPAASYADGEGRYGFEILGDGFAALAKENGLRVNDTAISFRTRTEDPLHVKTQDDCDHGFPCLVASRGALRVYGLGRADVQEGLRRLDWPLSLTVEVDQLRSRPQRLVLAPPWVDRWTPAVAAAVVLLAGIGIMLLLASSAVRHQGRAAPLGTGAGGGFLRAARWLLLDSATNTFSLSKLQLLVWSFAALFAYVFLAACQSLVQWRWGLPPVPDGLPTMLGVTAGTSAVVAVLAETRGRKGAGPPEPALYDFVSTGGVFAPERFQFLLWTLVGVVGFLVATVMQDPATVTELPKIPDNFLPLMGVSSLGYVFGKAARKAGPSVRSAAPAAFSPNLEVLVDGANLSPRAVVLLNGAQVPVGDVHAADGNDAAEFTPRLKIKAPAGVTLARKGVPMVKVTNPDGQSAEYDAPAPVVRSRTVRGDGSVELLGENLSPAPTELVVNGQKLQAPRIAAEPAGAELASRLTVSPSASEKIPPTGSPSVKLTNPDGQSAELK